MKQLLKVLALMLVLVLAISVMVACNDDNTDGGNTDGKGDSSDAGDENEGDANAKFVVTFKFIDKNGSPLKDVEGYTETAQKNVKYGKDARDPASDDVTLFDKYVIIGWNADEAAAKAGTVDANALKGIKKDTTLYSVIRDKAEKTVTFLGADGTTVLGTIKYLEGAALGKDTPRPTVSGQYFKKWDFVKGSNTDGATESNETVIYGDCSFKAIMGATDGTIGKTASKITLDGIKDAAYTTSNTYLALNNKKTANDSKTIDNDGSYTDPGAVKADTWMVWDGAYIYLLIEVYDTTLTYRSEAYAKTGPDAWCNDAVELWYNFEQDASLTKNSTRIGLGASGDRAVKGDAKYALPRSIYGSTVTGIGGGRSTHFEEIDYAVRNYLVEKSNGRSTEGLDADGKTAPSYVIEFKIPAKPEAQADVENWGYYDWDGAKEQKLTGVDLENFKATGRLYGVDPSEDKIDFYRFTEVDNLQVGDYIRLSLQVNDLRIGVAALARDYFDSVTLKELQDVDASYDQTAYDGNKIKLWELVDGKIKTASTYDKFTAAGSTQYDITKYLMFSLGGTEEGAYFVYDYQKSKTDHKAVIMLDKDGNVYERALIAE